jgi:hypothetical protein
LLEHAAMNTHKRSGGRRVGTSTSKKVGKAMPEQKHATLHSGSSGRKVKIRKQSIAIGLSEGRTSGAKAPSKRPSRARARNKKK